MAQDISSNEVNSHIQMPRFMLKRFCKNNTTGKFFAYSVLDDFIRTNSTAKSTNTELGYYSIDTEEFLNQSTEIPFCNALLFIDKTDFNQPNIKIPEAHQRAIKRFAHSLFARDPNTSKVMCNTSVYLQFSKQPSEQSKHDLAAEVGTELANEVIPLSDYFITFCINVTDIPFVLPICGLTDIFKDFNFILPISPYMAIFLSSQRLINTRQLDNEVSIGYITDPNEIKFINDNAFSTQIDRQWGYVICHKREELDRLKSKYQAIINKYKKSN